MSREPTPSRAPLDAEPVAISVNPGAATPTGEVGDDTGGFNTALSDWLIRFAAGGLILMTAIIGWQVFGRFVLNSSPSWSEQGALILMIWYVLFAAAAGVREGFHIRIALLEKGFALRTARRIRLAINLIVAGFGIAMLVFGTQLVWLVWDHDVPSLGLPRGVAYIPLPVSGFLITMFALSHARLRWRRLRGGSAG